MAGRFTQADLDALNSAIASGHLRVEYDGKKVEYRSLADLRSARDEVAADLGVLNPGADPNADPRAAGFYYPKFNSGIRS